MNRHSRAEDDGLALGVAVKPYAFGVPLTRFQGLTAPPGQAKKAHMPCLPKMGIPNELVTKPPDPVRMIES